MTDERVHTPVGRVQFAYVDEPARHKNPDGSDKVQYEVTLIWDEDTDLTVLQDLAKHAAIGKWGPGVKFGPLKMPINPNSRKEGTEGFENQSGFYAAFRSKYKPGVVLANAQPAPDGTIYPGCYARVSTSAWAFDVSGSKGVRFNLNNIQFIRDGDPLSSGGGVAATEDFDPFE